MPQIQQRIREGEELLRRAEAAEREVQRLKDEKSASADGQLTGENDGQS